MLLSESTGAAIARAGKLALAEFGNKLEGRLLPRGSHLDKISLAGLHRLRFTLIAAAVLCSLTAVTETVQYDSVRLFIHSSAGFHEQNYCCLVNHAFCRPDTRA